MPQVFDESTYTWLGHFDSPFPCTGQHLLNSRLVVKDVFHIAGLPTGAGNPDWLASHSIPDTTASVVRSLLESGTTLIGKTQSDELAYSLNGLNVHYGAPPNPWNSQRLPGGSSTGSAVAVAVGEADVGLGSDTGGSIRVPASYNGLFGLRPSHGLIATDGMLPLAPLFDTVGWMTRDASTLRHVGDTLLPDYLPLRNGKNGELAEMRILEPTIDDVPLWDRAHDEWLECQEGIRVSERIQVSDDWLSRASRCFRILQGRAIWRTHGDWIMANQPRFASDIHERFEWCRTLTEADEQSALAEQSSLVSDIGSWLKGADAVVLPTTPGPAPLLNAGSQWMNCYRRQLMGLTAPAGLAGLPQLHLPVLTFEQAPAGVSLLGARCSDRVLLQLAEDVFAGDQRPRREPVQ